MIQIELKVTALNILETRKKKHTDRARERKAKEREGRGGNGREE